MKCLNKSLPLVKRLLETIPSEVAISMILDNLGENATYEQVVAENQRLMQQSEAVPSSVASPETISRVKNLLEKMGVSIKDLATYAKEAGLAGVKGINGVADLTKKIIAIAEGKEDVALVEEMVHIATAILEQKNPQLVTQMISKIDRFAIYKRTLDEYKNNPAYQLPNGKPNIRKIKKEAVDKLISELIIFNNQGTTEFPELMDETNRSIIRTFFEKILDWFRGMYKSANIDIFQEAAGRIMVGETQLVKPGVMELFESNPELASIGTPEQYSEYLDTIFPESKVKDIVYHGTDKELKKFYDNLRSGIHFGTLKQAEGRRRATDFEFKRNAKFISAIIDLKNPLKTKDFDWEKAGDAFTSWQPGDDLSDLDFTEYLISSGIIKEEEIQDAEGDFDLINKKGYDGVVYKNEGAGETTGENSYAVSKSEQIHILGNKQDIEGFIEFVKTAPSDINLSSYGLYYQLSDPQKNVQQLILQTQDGSIIKKVEDKKATDPLLMDTEEASNWYEVKQPDGTWARITKRVTDRVKDWYKRRFFGKTFTEEEKRFNEIKRQLGVKGHKFFEEIHGRYFNSDGTRKKNVESRSMRLSPVDEEVYRKLENYYVGLIDKFSKDGKNPLVFSEVIIYDPKEKEAGTIDLLIVEESGKANIIDWKFMSVAPGAKDVAWYKQGAYNIQLGRYKEILKDRYGVKEIGMNRAVPIIMELKLQDPKVKTSAVNLAGIAIGSVNTEEIEDLRLVPVSEETESTGFERLDELIKKLNAAYKQIAKKTVTEEDEREFKRDRLNILKEAIRVAQGTLNIAPLVDVIKVMRKEGQQILDDYNTTYKGRPANEKGEDFTDEKLSDFSASMREYSAFADVFGRIDDLIGELIYNKEMEKAATTEEAQEDVAMRKELLRNISDEAREIRLSSEQIKKVSGEFADKFIGQKNLVKGLLSPEAVVKGLSSTFRGISELPMASLQVLYKLVTNAKGRASRDALTEVNKLMEIRKKIVDKGGDVRQLVKQIYQKDDKDKIVNKLIYKFDKAFFDGVDNNALEGARSKAWLMENIDVDAYRKEAKELLDKKIERIKKLYDEDEDLMERLILEEQRKWDIDRKDFIGWSNHIVKRHPLTKWYSEEYKNLLKNPELLELYNFISEMNQKAKSSGYISNQAASTFLPFIRKGMAESLAWDFDLSAVMNFGKNLQLQADDVGYGQVNELTGELENAIPKYYTYDFTKGKDGVNDYSDVSEDIFKNMILYINHMEKYKYLSEVEEQLQLVKTIETFKGYINTDRVGEVVYKDGKPQIMAEGQSTSEGNTKIFNDFLRALLYEQKYPLSDSDTPLGVGKVMNFIKNAINNAAGREVFKPEENPSATSLVKTMDAANRAFQLKTLGLEFISGAVNAFGGNIQIATQAGNYFKAREVLANEVKLVGNKFKNDEERDMFLQLIDTFMPLKDDPTYEKLQKSGLTTLTRVSFSDWLMVFMREPEQHIEKSIFLTLLDNMMVENGKIVSIREFVKKKYKDRYDSASRYKEVSSKIDEEIEELKKTRSINATKKLEDGKLVIPGLDLNNIIELQRLTNLTRRISRNATGNLADSDLNRMGMSIWTKSMMIFKNWIPKLVDTRFGEFRKVSDDFSVEIGENGITTGEKYDIGRIRLFAYVLGTSIRDRSTNIINILSLNEKGLATLDKMYEEFAQQYEKRTGKPLEMDRDEFIDMVRTNLRNQIKELAILMSMFGAMVSLGFVAPDDDDDRADKNFHRYTERVIDKFIGELSFFYNPAEFQKILSGSMFPAIGIFSDIGRFSNHFFMETTGIDTSNPELSVEQVRKKAQPIKNFGKMFPISKSLFTYGGIIDAEFAKEFDITIQKESRR